MNFNKRTIFLCGFITAVVAALVIHVAHRIDAEAVDATPTMIQSATEKPEDRPVTMADVLEIAKQGRQQMAENLDDYVCRFVKQARDTKGVLFEQTEALMKVQTRLRGDTEQAPLRVYMKFLAPDSKRGREVIWGEDLNNGKLVAHEAGLLGFKRLYLDPLGFLAMQGERYPITNVGMVHLIERLVERGERLINNPDVEITVVPDYPIDDVTAELIQIRLAKPQAGKDDFSLAELAIDRQRWLILMYRSFGWPENEGEAAPLLESYHYHDVETNIGLTDEDFSPDNPEYNFPSF